jgi:hypothetical protein
MNGYLKVHGPIPNTPATETGSCGFHYWFSFPPGTTSGKNVFGPGIDLKANGGYVLIPPSHVWIPDHRQPYRWKVKPWEVPIAPAPDWLVAMLAKPKGAKAPATGKPVPSPWVVQAEHDLRTHPGIGEGQRRVTLCRLVGAHLGKGDQAEAIWQWASEWASRCNPQFDEWEKHVAGLVKREAAQPSSPLPRSVPLWVWHPTSGRKELTPPMGRCQLVPSFRKQTRNRIPIAS